ncbi:hypothetical protein [Vibrio parahaemolyticus]|uniref:hypothetical protein n=1 Tax=Vibrio parahaemolyticus TaxID=670 RepID=UPI0011241E6A|nr:hypothetical protein [Vibrio parahaemolyticus]TPA69930.1 hypothetical protein DXJ77_23440 [Vibrio parahaemolyticus]
MSTQEIGALIDSVNKMTDTVANKISEIDEKVNQATSAVPSTVKALFDQTLYVNETTGNSANDGLSDAKPLKYLEDAIYKVPSGGKARIVVRTNIVLFHNKWPLNGKTKQEIIIAAGRTIYIDLAGNDLIINTSHYNSWGADKLNAENPCLDKNFNVRANSFLEIYNGNIRLSPQSGDEGKSLYSHTSMCSLFNNDSSRTQLSNMKIDSTIASAGLFGLDNWGAMGFNSHIRDTTLTGVGLMKRVVNGAVADDIIIKKINVTSTWTE